jgi:hypothetical protein
MLAGNTGTTLERNKPKVDVEKGSCPCCERVLNPGTERDLQNLEE